MLGAYSLNSRRRPYNLHALLGSVTFPHHTPPKTCRPTTGSTAKGSRRWPMRSSYLSSHRTRRHIHQRRHRPTQQRTRLKRSGGSGGLGLGFSCRCSCRRTWVSFSWQSAKIFPRFTDFLPSCSTETLDYTVVATAQPHIASQFNRLDLQSWIGTSYVLTSTVFLPIFGSIADILGRHWAMWVTSALLCCT